MKVFATARRVALVMLLVVIPLTLKTATAEARSRDHACSDGVDNDHDGLIDGADPGCRSDSDRSEVRVQGPAACDNGLDDDGDGNIDFGGGRRGAGTPDPGCTGPGDPDESDAVTPGTLGCTTPTTDTENPPGDTADDSNKQYDFGFVFIGASTQVTVTCAAGGATGAQVTVGGISLQGDVSSTDGFTLAGGSCETGSVVVSGSSCSVVVAFSPAHQAALNGYNATLHVDHDGTNGPTETVLFQGGADIQIG